MPRYTYTGDAEQPYPQYLDAGKGTTLVAVPGTSYDVTPAEGWDDMPVPPRDGRWTDDKPAAVPRRGDGSEES